MGRHVGLRSVFGLLCLLVLAGCGIIPADPDGTLERIHGGEIRVGISSSAPWTSFEDGEPSGIEADLLEAFAAEQGATINWTPGGEEQLIGQLKAKNLDIVVGGLTDKSPWSSDAALTRPYRAVRNDLGEMAKHVMAVRMGENSLLLELDKFLHEEGDQL